MYSKIKITIYLFVVFQIVYSKSNLCGNSNPFYLSINKEPKFYVPKANYIVGIESNDFQPFTKFSLTTEPDDEKSIGHPIGWFHLMADDNEVQFSMDEMNTIIQQNNSPKQSVHTLWTAPSTHICLFLKAEVSYEIDSQSCKQNLKRKICALEEQISALGPDDNCCACDEASYSMIFEGLWSNETHPKNFPVTLQLTHFSDILACTHSKNVTMWAEGEYATEGVRQLAEFGSASILESELLEKKKHLRSLVKIPGLWYPKMNSNTSTKFRVDKRHNLLSVGSMLGPSPDWFTGISKLNLCTKSCTWIENKVVDVGLYDAGTDSGVLYMSPDSPTIPQERIYRITGSYPEDPRAPFYNIYNDTVKPIARIYLKRERVIEKSCSEDSMIEFDDIDLNEEDKRPACRTTNYTEWSPCSASCGKGLNMKIRHYVDPIKAKISNCSKRNVLKKLCIADTPCPGDNDDDNSIRPDEEHCKTTNWTEWSECTATCGIGIMTRARRFLKHSGYKKCTHVNILEKKKCMEPPCKTTVVEKEMSNCTTTEWSDWSPCLVKCGKGVRLRVRYLTVPQSTEDFCKKNIKLEERRDCFKGC